MNKSTDNIDDRTLVVLNCHKNVTEELLYELFVQAGPVQNVKKRKACPHAFVTFFHSESVPYTIKVMNGIRLFGQPLRLRPRPHTRHCYGEPNDCDYPEPLWCVLVPYPREDYVREIRKMNDRIHREQQQQRERYARNMRNTYPGSSYHFNTHDARHYDSYRYTYWNQGYYENERGRHGKQYRGNTYQNSRASYSSANYGKSTRPKQQYKKGHPPAR
ncbi:RNA-binding protein 7 [Trichinella papuae]|uniref:RNA-binding protein 7 n=1 Tax=Trichinella papuae TaxID=268474 RepID=A0A0V1MI35_9BILA|nr:RNA-binding protein 7 [Trichinella papuae]